MSKKQELAKTEEMFHAMFNRKRARSRLYDHDGKGAAVSSQQREAALKTRPAAGLQSKIQAAIRDAHFAQSIAADMRHRETFEESNDFDVGDDYEAEDDLYSDLDAPPAEDDGNDMERNFARALVGVFESAGIKFPQQEEPPEEKKEKEPSED